LKVDIPNVKVSLMSALVTLGDTRAIEPLIAALEDDRHGVRINAETDLRKFGSLAVEPLIAALRHPAYILRSYDLRLLSWGDGSGVPNSGRNLVIAGIDNNRHLQIRGFDDAGKRIDTDETKLTSTQAGVVGFWKQRLPDMLPPHVLTGYETTEL